MTSQGALTNSFLDSTQDVSAPPPPVLVTVKYFSPLVYVFLRLRGAHQIDNLGTALTAILDVWTRT